MANPFQPDCEMPVTCIPTRSPLLPSAVPALRIARIAAFLLFAGLPYESSAGSFATASATQLANFSLEELMQVQVYSVSKQPEKSFTAPSAIHVITNDDIRRSGVTSLPEALRLAPGVQVSRIDGNKWAISIRGFAGRFSNKLLVLQDGRTLYNPMFSGVYWNVQEIMLEDIEQIEVIRGPGSTLWGANAVNGVISITTRHARDTQGGVITAAGGTWERAATGIRYGIKSGENGFVRGYGTFFYRDSQPPVDTPDLEGYWNDWRGGFRGDWDLASHDTVTLQGDAYESRAGSGFFDGVNLLGRWNRGMSDTSDLSIQLYYDRASAKKRVDADRNHHETRDTANFELQHTFAPGSRQKVVWGTGFRLTHDQLNGNTAFVPAFIPASMTEHLFSAFLQDKITLLSDSLYLILGSRIEHADITGWELQPTARILWTPHEQHTFWSAVTRAVRTPSRAETTILSQVGFIPPVTEIRLIGNSRLPSEKLIAYEAGYRYQPLPVLFFDLALFYNDYRSLIGAVQGLPQGGAPPTLVPVNIASTSTAVGRGGELSVDWRPRAWLELAVAYSFLDLSVSSSSVLPQDKLFMNVDTSPRHQLSVNSVITLPHNVNCTIWLRYVDSLSGPEVPDYVTMDARVAWKPVPNLELSLVGQNLLAAKHLEFGPDLFGNPAAQTERSMYGKVAWKF